MKQILKSVAHAIATLIVLPLWILYVITRALSGSLRAFPGFAQCLSLLPGTSGVYVRRAFYQLVLSRCGTDSCISFGTVFSHPTAEIGESAYIGIGCMLGDVTLGNDVLLGSHVSIINGNRQHGIDRLDVPVREQAGTYPRITIGADTWIGDRAIVMADVGQHAVVGAGSVVTKPVPDFAIVVGNPARQIGDRRNLSSVSNEVDQERTSESCVETKTESASVEQALKVLMKP